MHNMSIHLGLAVGCLMCPLMRRNSCSPARRPFFTTTIYIDASRWTPESWIEAHERGHVNDLTKTVTSFLNQSGAMYQTFPGRAGKDFVGELRRKNRTDRLQRDNFFAKLWCQ
jgi:hypothetical protein